MNKWAWRIADLLLWFVVALAALNSGGWLLVFAFAVFGVWSYFDGLFGLTNWGGKHPRGR